MLGVFQRGFCKLQAYRGTTGLLLRIGEIHANVIANGNQV